MKHLALSATVIATLMAPSAYAGALEFVADEPHVIVEPVDDDWAGLSLGAKYVNTFDATQGYYF